MSIIESDENKRQMRLNIIRHRQTLLQHLESINDTVLKPRIKLQSKDFAKYNLNFTINHNPHVKSEETKGASANPYAMVAVTSIEESDGIYDISDETNTQVKRYSRLARLKSNGHKIQCKCFKCKNLKNGAIIIYDSDEDENNMIGAMSRSLNSSSSNEVSFRNMSLFSKRTMHNAKERECRNNISKLFRNLSKFCSYLNTNRRVPAKHNILLGAKNECELLRLQEKKMMVEKEKLQHRNDLLRQKLAYIRQTANL